MSLRILLLAALLIPSPVVQAEPASGRTSQDVLSLCEWTGFECDKRKPHPKPKPKPAAVKPEVKIPPSNWDVKR